ncbi:MAG: hypothetical protein LC635_03190, partial [Pseudonocardiaceae bacterium]|nr:hypothetical protein [Pseudonocardiaceae bacterium]
GVCARRREDGVSSDRAQRAIQHRERSEQFNTATFSGLYFAAAAATDQHYREAFFEPPLADVRVSLAARQVYLARRDDAS